MSKVMESFDNATGHVGKALRTGVNAQIARLYGVGAMPGVTDDGTGYSGPAYGRTVNDDILYGKVTGTDSPYDGLNRLLIIKKITEGKCLALNLTADGWLLPPSPRRADNSLADYLSYSAARVVRADEGKELEMTVELQPRTNLKGERLASYITVSTFRTTTPSRGGAVDSESQTFVCGLPQACAVGAVLGVMDKTSNPIGYRK